MPEPSPGTYHRLGSPRLLPISIQAGPPSQLCGPLHALLFPTLALALPPSKLLAQHPGRLPLSQQPQVPITPFRFSPFWSKTPTPKQLPRLTYSYGPAPDVLGRLLFSISHANPLLRYRQHRHTRHFPIHSKWPPVGRERECLKPANCLLGMQCEQAESKMPS